MACPVLVVINTVFGKDVSPLFATKNMILVGFSLSSKTGVMTVRSGKCVPPAHGWLERMTSPGLRPSFPYFSAWYLMAVLIDPRWPGMCGAFATSPPDAEKMAHE